MGNGIPSDPNIEGLFSFFDVTEEWLLDRNYLKNYINKERNLRKKTIIISLLGIIISYLLIIFTFIGFFKQLNDNPNLSHILLYTPPKSIFDYLGIGVIIPVFFYVATSTISFINIIQFIKEEFISKMLICNVSLIIISILFYLASFIIGIVLAKEKGFGIIL